MATVFERVRDIVAETLVVSASAVKLESSLGEGGLGADSLAKAELLMALEDKFSTPERKVDVSDADAEQIKTIRDIVDYLESKGITDEE